MRGTSYETEEYHISYVTGFMNTIKEYLSALRYELARVIEGPTEKELNENV